MNDIDGKPVPLSEFRGRVLLVVNTASRCGFTSYDFLGQEPGTNEQIKEFCTLNYGVTFPMFGKIVVKGRDIHPLYGYLTAGETNGEFAGGITWNFNKFLIGRDGRIIARFGTGEEPTSDTVIKAVEAALAQQSALYRLPTYRFPALSNSMPPAPYWMSSLCVKGVLDLGEHAVGHAGVVAVNADAGGVLHAVGHHRRFDHPWSSQIRIWDGSVQ